MPSPVLLIRSLIHNGLERKSQPLPGWAPSLLPPDGMEDLETVELRFCNWISDFGMQRTLDSWDCITTVRFDAIPFLPNRSGAISYSPRGCFRLPFNPPLGPSSFQSSREGVAGVYGRGPAVRYMISNPSMVGPHSKLDLKCMISVS